jgi:SAM-dependent methyltransferase
MSSSINKACDACETPLSTPVYQPQGTHIGAEVYVCSNCGLVQTLATPAKRIERIQTLSCDADWGNVRHSKGARLNAAIGLLAGILPPRRILDIGANRGDFVLWAAGHFPNAEIVALEPDRTVVERYSHDPRITTQIGRFEHFISDQKFDLIYCSHTLEHAVSARGMLSNMANLLSPEGVAFIELPALEAIELAAGVEEFFIDKHTFHFDHGTFRALLAEAGFSVDVDNSDHYNLTVLCRHGERTPLQVAQERTTTNLRSINGYAESLQRNREILTRMVRERLHPLTERQRVAIFGAGRIFDALVKYGGLEPSRFVALVDNHLAGLMPTWHGIPIQKPLALKQMEPQVCLILARSSEEALGTQAYRSGIRHILKFSELFTQVSQDK